MSAKRYIADAGGVVRRIKKRFIIDAGGVVRRIKKRYVIDAGGVARLTFASVSDFTIGVATPGGGVVGYVNGSYGTISPNNILVDGHTVEAATYGNVSQIVRLNLGGFGSDPGIGYLSYLIFGNSQFNGVDATYSYSSGVAIWRWDGVTPTGIVVGAPSLLEISSN